MNATVLQTLGYTRKQFCVRKVVFKLKHKLQGFQDNFNFGLLDCDSLFEKFQQTFIDEIKHYVPEKKSKALRQVMD